MTKFMSLSKSSIFMYKKLQDHSHIIFNTLLTIFKFEYESTITQNKYKADKWIIVYFVCCKVNM